MTQRTRASPNVVGMYLWAGLLCVPFTYLLLLPLALYGGLLGRSAMFTKLDAWFYFYLGAGPLSFWAAAYMLRKKDQRVFRVLPWGVSILSILWLIW